MKNKILLVITCIFSAAFLFFIWKMSDDIQRKEEILLSSPAILNVTDLIKTRALVTDQDIPLKDIDSGSWKEVKIPDYQPVAEKDFKEGNFGYYEITIPKDVISKLEAYKNELEFSPQYVFFSEAEIWRNGKYVGHHSYRAGPSALLTVPVEPAVDNVILIKGKIKTGDSGIKHRGKILLGRKSEIREIHTSSYKGTIVFPMIFLLSKGSVIFVFALIYLLLNVGKFFEKSLIFSMCVFGEDLLTGDFLGNLLNINQRVYIYNFLNIMASVFLFLFLADVVEKKFPRKKVVVAGIVLAAISYLAAIDILHTSYVFNFNSFLLSWNLISMAVLAFYLPLVIKRDRVLFVVMVVAISLSGISLFYSNIGLNYKMFGNLLLFFMVAYQSFALFRREQVKMQEQEIQLIEQEKDVAIGKTASLLAHDVRRPLEQMKIILDKVAQGEVSTEFLNSAKKDVNFSLTSVNHQINDIMNYSKSAPAKLSEMSLYGVLSSSVKQIMTINKNVDLKLEYDFKALKKVMGDEGRLAGVFTNLISNAVEAIRDIGHRNSGVIRLSTAQEGDHIFLTIFNDGPAIPENMLNEIWKPMFSFGKEKGTGLGLSAVKKTIQDHQGEISVANRNGGVEFRILLMASSSPDKSQDYEFQSSSSAYHYEARPVDGSKLRPIRIFLLDDDVQVHQYFLSLVKNLPFHVDFTFSTHIETARVAVKDKRFDLYILDADNGSGMTGEKFRKECLSFLHDEVVIHRSKPMTFEEFTRHCENAYASRLKVLLVEDGELTRMIWESFHGKHNIKTVSAPEDAIQIMENGTEKYDVCVVDYYFDNSHMTGETLAKKIKSLHPELEVLIASNAEVSIEGFPSIEKNQFDVRRLGFAAQK